jgi:hypothetical protein
VQFCAHQLYLRKTKASRLAELEKNLEKYENRKTLSC